MKYTFFPKETSNFKSEFDSIEIIKILKENTLIGNLSSTAYVTNKKFIGSVENESFEIISSSYLTSMFCVFEGKLENENRQITLVKKFHPTFRNLIFFWGVAMLSLFIFLPGRANPVFTIIMFLAFVFLLRNLFIKFIFKKSKDDGIEKLINTLKLTEIE